MDYKTFYRKWAETRRKLYRALLEAKKSGDEAQVKAAEAALQQHDAIQWA